MLPGLGQLSLPAKLFAQRVAAAACCLDPPLVVASPAVPGLGQIESAESGHDPGLGVGLVLDTIPDSLGEGRRRLTNQQTINQIY